MHEAYKTIYTGSYNCAGLSNVGYPHEIIAVIIYAVCFSYYEAGEWNLHFHSPAVSCNLVVQRPLRADFFLIEPSV